jgi:hypothetical protein
VAREAEREQDRGDLLVRERVRVLVVDFQERAGEVVTALVGLRRDQLAQIPAVEHHLLGVMDLLVRRRPPPRKPGAAATPRLQLLPVGARDAHEAEHHRGRQRERQRGHEVEGL